MTTTPEYRITEVLALHKADGYGTCRCGWDAESLDPLEFDIQHGAHQLAEITALPDVAIVVVPRVGHKAEGETDAQRYRDIARRIRDGHVVGGSNSRAATAELLDRVARAAGGGS